MGFKGVYITQTCFHDAHFFIMHQSFVTPNPPVPEEGGEPSKALTFAQCPQCGRNTQSLYDIAIMGWYNKNSKLQNFRLNRSGCTSWLSMWVSGRVGVIKIVIVINCNLITFFKIIENNCNSAFTLITVIEM